MVDESLVLFMINSFLLLSIDSSRVWFTYLQTQTQVVSLIAVVSLVALVIKDEVAKEYCIRDVESFKVVNCVMLVVSGIVVMSVVVTDRDVVVLCVIVVDCSMVEACEHNTTLDGISFFAKRHVEQLGTSMKVSQLLRKQPKLEVSTAYALQDDNKSHTSLHFLSVAGTVIKGSYADLYFPRRIYFTAAEPMTEIRFIVLLISDIYIRLILIVHLHLNS